MAECFWQKKESTPETLWAKTHQTTVATKICQRPECHGSYPWTYLCQGCPDQRRTGYLQKEGRCFNCKKQGHIGQNCPLKAGGSKAQSGETTKDANQTQSSIKKLTADDLINIMQGMDEGEKDKMIQEVFMKEDFA